MKLIIAMLAFFFLNAQFVPSQPMVSPPTPHHYIKVKELHRRLLSKEHIIVVDARSNYAYEKEHIKNAISLPLAEIQMRANSLQFGKEDFIVTYCSCPHHIAEMAADVLTRLGYKKVYVLDEGLPGWLRFGYPVSGELANQPVAVYWVLGIVTGEFKKPKAGVEVRVFQPLTDQLEIGTTGKDGFYSMPLRFYGLRPGDQLQASIGGDTIFFTIGPKRSPWGTRIDDVESHVVLRENDFLKTFKSRKLHQ